MPFDAHSNFAYSAVAIAPSPAASGTSLTVTAGHGARFPAAPFNATVWATGEIPLITNGEIVRVTAVVGDVLTIVRAQEGSSARAVIVGDQIAATITAKTLTDVETAIPSTAGLLSNIKVSAGTLSAHRSDVTFANANGVSFGLETNGVLTGTVATNYQSAGAYLTTAMQSASSSVFAKTGFTTTTIAGAVVAGTHDTDGLKLAVPAYLTTAMGSNRGSDFVQATAVFAGTSASGTIASGGISVSIGPYLTTAMASNAVTLSNVKVSGGTSSAHLSAVTFGDGGGVSFGLAGSVLTAAAPVGAPSPVNFSAGTTSGNLASVVFSNSNGVSFGINGSTITGTVATNYQSQGAYLTTAMLSNAATISNVRLSAGTTSNLLSAVTFSNSNGVSFGLDAGTVTATVKTDYQTAGAYLTTAALSNHSHGASAAAGSFAFQTLSFSNANGVSFGTSAGPAVTASVAAQSNQTVGLYASSNTYLTSSGTVDARSLSFRGDKSITVGVSAGEVVLSVGPYITTAALSNHSHGNPTLNLTNLSGTTASASNGFTLSLSAGNYLTTAMASNRGSDFVQANAAFAGTNASGTIASNGISVSVAAPGAGGAVNFSAGTTSSNLDSVVFSNANRVSFGLNGSTITACVAVGMSQWMLPVGGATSTRADLIPASLSNAWVFPAGMNPFPGDMTPDQILFRVTGNITATASSSSNTVSFWLGFYTWNASTLSLAFSASSALILAAATNNTAMSHGDRWLTFDSTLFNVAPAFTQTNYWGALMMRTSNLAPPITCVAFAQYPGANNSGTLGISSIATSAGMAALPFLGKYSATSTALPGSIKSQDIVAQPNSANMFVPYLIFNKLAKTF